MFIWKKTAACVRCGVFKRRTLARCTKCGFIPTSEYEIARALILSQAFQAGDITIGRPWADLQRMAADIRSGRPYLFDPNEEQTVLYAYRYLEETAHKRRRQRQIILWIVIALVTSGMLYALLRSAN